MSLPVASVCLGPALLENPLPVEMPAGTLPAGDVDLYTCPQGRQAIPIAVTGRNGSAGAITCWTQVKVGGLYYPTTGAQSPGAGAAFTLTSISPVLSAGQTFGFHSAAAGLFLTLRIIEFDVHPYLSSSIVAAFGAGDNLVFQCPDGRTALLYDGGTNVQNQPGVIVYSNASGGPRTVTAKVGSQALGPAVTVASGAVQAFSCPHALGALEELLLNVDSGAAGQFAWATPLVVDASVS